MRKEELDKLVRQRPFKAFQGEKFKLPVLGDIAEQKA